MSALKPLQRYSVGTLGEVELPQGRWVLFADAQERERVLVEALRFRVSHRRTCWIGDDHGEGERGMNGPINSDYRCKECREADALVAQWEKEQK